MTRIGWAVAAAVLAASPCPARACGGFACSAAIPVVQVGEQIVYVVGSDGSLTMSVRIPKPLPLSGGTRRRPAGRPARAA